MNDCNYDHFLAISARNAFIRKELHAIHQLFWFGQFGNQFQVIDTPANGNPHLVGTNNACELNPSYLALFGFDQQVVILAE